MSVMFMSFLGNERFQEDRYRCFIIDDSVEIHLLERVTAYLHRGGHEGLHISVFSHGAE